MSGPMDQFLAEYYGTGKTAEATVDETEKQAQIELFAKMAAAEGIDLTAMSDEQVEQLYTQTFSKAAEEEPKDEHEEKKEEAKKEHEEKKAASEKVAEADFLGRVMAHAYVQELNKIAAAEGGETKEAAMPPWLAKGKEHAGKALEGAKKGLHRYGELMSGSKAKAHKGVAEKAKSIAGAAKERGSSAVHEKATGLVKKHVGAAHEEGKKVNIARGATAAAGLAAAGGTAAAMHKKSSALDDLAAERAIEKAAAAGWDAEEAGERVAALMILGPSEENSKVAAAADVEQAVDVRAAELLEMAGYPVNWE